MKKPDKPVSILLLEGVIWFILLWTLFVLITPGISFFPWRQP